MSFAVALDDEQRAVPRLRKLHVTVLFVCVLVAFLDGFDVQLISFMAPAISRELHVEKDLFGLIFSAGIAGMLVGMVGQGPLSDRFGRKPMALGCIALFGICTLACGIVGSTTELLALRFLGGLGMGAIMPNVFALVIEIAPAHWRSRMVVILGAGVPIGGLVASAFSAWLLPHIGWRALFIIGGILPLMLFPILLIFLPESPLFLRERAARRTEAGRLKDRENIEALVRRGWGAVETAGPSVAVPGVSGLFTADLRRNTLLLWLIAAINMVIFYSLLSWLPMILVSSGTAENLAALSGAMLNLGAIVGSFPLGWLADRLGAAKTLSSVLLAGACIFFLAGAMLGGSYGVFLAICMLCGGVAGGGNLVLNAFVGQIYPTAVRATGIGFAGVAGRAGAIAGPAICGFLLAAGVREAWLLALFAGPALIGALACLKLR